MDADMDAVAALWGEYLRRANDRLDSSRFMTDAHELYRSVGFTEIEPYDGSEIPADLRHHWLFMELQL